MHTNVTFDLYKLSRHPKPNDSMGYLLQQLSALWRRRLNARLAGIGITHVQFMFLIGTAWLTRANAEVTQSELGAYCKTSRALTSQVIRTLERNLLIVQKVKPDDARARLVSLTPKGEEVVKSALPILDAAEDEFLSSEPILKARVHGDLRDALAAALREGGIVELDW